MRRCDKEDARRILARIAVIEARRPLARALLRLHEARRNVQLAARALALAKTDNENERDAARALAGFVARLQTVLAKWRSLDERYSFAAADAQMALSYCLQQSNPMMQRPLYPDTVEATIAALAAALFVPAARPGLLPTIAPAAAPGTLAALATSRWPLQFTPACRDCFGRGIVGFATCPRCYPASWNVYVQRCSLPGPKHLLP